MYLCVCVCVKRIHMYMGLCVYTYPLVCMSVCVKYVLYVLYVSMCIDVYRCVYYNHVTNT